MKISNTYYSAHYFDLISFEKDPPPRRRSRRPGCATNDPDIKSEYDEITPLDLNNAQSRTVALTRQPSYPKIMVNVT